MFIPDNNSLHWLLEHWQEIDNETTRQAVLMMMHENYQAKRIPNTTWMNALLNGIHCEKNPLIASTLTNYLSSPLQETSSVERDKMKMSFIDSAILIRFLLVASSYYAF